MRAYYEVENNTQNRLCSICSEFALRAKRSEAMYVKQLVII